MESLFADAGSWLQSIGPWALVLAPLLMAAVAILPVPAEAPAMINGAIFGPLVGSVVTWMGAILGAHISIELARFLGRPAAERLVSAKALGQVDDLANRLGWSGLLIARFIPIVAFTALNWGAGLTAIPRWRFCWTTALGILPAAIVFTVSGAGFWSLIERWPLPTVMAIALLTAAGVFLVVRRKPSDPRPLRASSRE